MKQEILHTNCTNIISTMFKISSYFHNNEFCRGALKFYRIWGTQHALNAPIFIMTTGNSRNIISNKSHTLVLWTIHNTRLTSKCSSISTCLRQLYHAYIFVRGHVLLTLKVALEHTGCIFKFLDYLLSASFCHALANLSLLSLCTGKASCCDCSVKLLL